jgi:hypothetical protein
VRTREKFEEMNVPVLKGMSHFSDKDLSQPPPKSAFERGADVTAYDVEEGLDGAGIALQALKQSFAGKAKKGTPQDIKDALPSKWVPNLRWKHDGPWLPGMGADEFNAYITKQLSGRRREFNDYLVKFVKAQIYARRSTAAKQEGLPLDPQEAEKMRAAQEKEWATFTKADITAGIRALRLQCAADPLNSDLVQKLIIPFLRLPPIKLKSTLYAQNQMNIVDQQKFADETTPNSTHPSAGLSYLRTKAYLTNHPILGPQALPTPITARVIQPRKTRIMIEQKARLGVAGFVADDEYTAQSNAARQSARVESLEVLDVKTEGGRKVHVQPLFAAVSPDGKIFIKTKRSNGPELQVARGLLEDRPPERENVEKVPVGNFSFGLGKSGVKELDDAAEVQMQSFFDVVRQVESGEKKTENKEGDVRERR